MSGQGRPVLNINLPTLYPWATEVNYPSGPKAGHPIVIAPSADYHYPGLPLPAQVVNHNVSGLSTADSNVLAFVENQDSAIMNWAGLGPALNWYPIQTALNMARLLNGSASAAQWLAASYNVFHNSISMFSSWDVLMKYTVGGVDSFVVLQMTGSDVNDGVEVNDGGPSGAVSNPVANGWSVCRGASGGSQKYVFFTQVSSTAGALGGLYVYKIDESAGTTSNLQIILNVQTLTDVTMLQAGGHIVIGVTDSAGTNSGIYCSVDNGTTWTHTSFPTVTGKFYIAQGPTPNSLVFVAKSTGTGLAGISGDNGVSWTSGAMGLPTTAGAVTGLATGTDTAGNAAWWTFADIGGGLAKVFKSNTGSSGYNAVSPSGFASGNVSDMQALGGLLVGWNGHNFYQRGLLSVDGGVTFRVSQARLTDGSNDVKLEASPVQLCAFTRGGQLLRFSHCAGLPVQTSGAF